MAKIEGVDYSLTRTEVGDVLMLTKNKVPCMTIPEHLYEDFVKIISYAAAANRLINEEPLYKVTNDEGVVKSFYSDEEFLIFAKKIYKENEDDNPYPSEIHWLPENIQQAKEYIHEYCSNLKLEEL